MNTLIVGKYICTVSIPNMPARTYMEIMMFSKEVTTVFDKCFKN